MAVVLTLAPAFAELPPNWLRGEVTAGKTVVRVFGWPYNFPGFSSNITQGASDLDAALHTYTGQTITVLGHSMGSEVAYHWLDTYGPAASSYANPSNVNFVLTGCPQRRYGGIHRVPSPPLGTVWVYPGTPGLTGDASPYPVKDVARQYDFYADYPNAANPSQTARDNASMFIHGDYNSVSLTDPNRVEVVEGNITYVLIPTPLDPAKRVLVESAYVRPQTVPAPPVIPPPPTPQPTPLPDIPGDLPAAPADLYADARTVAAAAEKLAEQRDEDDEWIVTVYDFLWRRIGEAGDFIELSGTVPRNALPSATVKLKAADENIAKFAQCRNTLVGVTVETAGLRFAYYVDTDEYGFDKKPAWEGVGNLLGIWDVLHYLVIWPSYWLPLQFQPISHAVFFGPLCTVIEAMIAECAFRLQTGLWEFFNNALSLNLDVRAWIGTLLQQRSSNILEVLKTPIYVVRHNLLTDTSPLVAKTVRMETCGTVIADLTRAYGVDVRVDLWLPGDAQPDAYADLDQPTYVVTVKDRSQIEGPTKTVLDSALRLVVDAEGSLLGKTLDPLLNPQGFYAPEGVFIAPTLGLNFVMPYAIFDAGGPGEKTGLTSFKRVNHTPKGWQHVIGGKCVAGETLVHTTEGLVEAKTLEGREVMTLSAEGVYRPAKWKSYGEQQLFEVTFANGDVIYATDSHEWVVVGRAKRLATVDLVGERIPRVAHADRYGEPDYLASQGALIEVVAVKATDRFEPVYCCEEPVTNTWVAGDGYLTSNSPKWLNDLINATLSWLLDSVMIVLGFSGVPSNLLDGFMNDAFLAFQLIEHYSRRNEVGPYHPAMETFTATGSAPYNIEALFTFINKLWDTRGYTSAIASFRNGEVYALGRDVFSGGLATVAYTEADGTRKLFTDYIENVAFRVTNTERDITAFIGDNKAEEAPLAKHQRFITGLMEEFNVLTLAPNN